ncbi:MAG: FAD-linked oxidase C-terminal domain-containing protein [Elusimicrobiota bacterium]|jgi:glycolate oxidase subunit GlcD
MKDISSLKRLLPGRVFEQESELLAYSYDSSLERERPEAVVIASDAGHVRSAVNWCLERRVPYIARGAGTNLSGGCVPRRGGVVISTAGMKNILSIDTRERVAVVEPGVINLDLQKAAEPSGLFYAPDPASYRICTLGGNIAENAGGPRCLKYGVTTDHLLAVEAVLPDGSLERFSLSDAGPEFLSLLCGAEGTLGVLTRAWVKLTPAPAETVTLLAAFKSIEEAVRCVSAVIAAGIIPRVMEAMDRLSVESIEAYVHAGYPRAEAVLLIDLEGSGRALESDRARVEELCRTHGVCELRAAQDPLQRERLWEGRRSAYAALARLSPNVLVEDGVVPRSRLPEAARRAREIAAAYGVQSALLFHAGDGNLHPNIIFDERDREQTARVRSAGREMLRSCIELEGTISGEHGIGTEKRPAMTWRFEPQTLDLFGRVKKALDPEGLANPEKLLPLDGEELPGGLLSPARPLSTQAQALVDAVRERARDRKSFSVFGARTRAPKEALAFEKEGALSTRGLQSVLRVRRDDFIVEAEAGILISDLQSRLGAEGLRADIPRSRGTLGGMIAAKSWPSFRGSLLGMRLLLPDGRVCTLGGPVVKNVAGYDIVRLLLGSWGTLAVIVDVTFRVSPAGSEAVQHEPVEVRPGRMGSRHRRLKTAFDPQGLLNSWYERLYG